jgi:hypothetical protein
METEKNMTRVGNDTLLGVGTSYLTKSRLRLVLLTSRRVCSSLSPEPRQRLSLGQGHSRYCDQRRCRCHSLLLICLELSTLSSSITFATCSQLKPYIQRATTSSFLLLYHHCRPLLLVSSTSAADQYFLVFDTWANEFSHRAGSHLLIR